MVPVDLHTTSSPGQVILKVSYGAADTQQSMMADNLHSNEFWKKTYRAMQVRDTNRDGFISKADFDLYAQRYKEMGAPEEHIRKMNDVH